MLDEFRALGGTAKANRLRSASLFNEQNEQFRFPRPAPSSPGSAGSKALHRRS